MPAALLLLVFLVRAPTPTQTHTHGHSCLVAFACLSLSLDLVPLVCLVMERSRVLKRHLARSHFIVWQGVAVVAVVVVLLLLAPDHPRWVVTRQHFALPATGTGAAVVGDRANEFPLPSDKATKYLSIIVPAYNEQSRIQRMLDETLAYCDARQRASPVRLNERHPLASKALLWPVTPTGHTGLYVGDRRGRRWQFGPHRCRGAQVRRTRRHRPSAATGAAQERWQRRCRQASA